MTLATASTVQIELRAVRPSDAAAMQAYVTSLSAESRRLRFHARVNGCTEAMLRLLTDADPARGVALVATVDAGDGTGETIVGEARYFLDAQGRGAEFAISVANRWQGHGVADRLMTALVRAARAAGIAVLHGDVLEGNERMAGFMRRRGFAAVYDERVDCGIQRWERELNPLATAAAAMRVAAAVLRQVQRDLWNVRRPAAAA